MAEYLMQGQSRAALAAAERRLDEAVASGAAPAALGEALFGVAELFSAQPGLRRAVSDVSRPAQARETLVRQLLGNQVGVAALDLVAAAAADTWSQAADLPVALEQLAVLAYLIDAERSQSFDTVEDELFRFSRTVAGDTGLRDAFAARTSGRARKVQLVQSLLGGKVAPQTLALAEQAAVGTRGRRTEQILAGYLERAAQRRHQLVADVVSATDLSLGQRARLSQALQRLFDRPIRLNVQRDPAVIGGLRVQVAGELLDSTMLARLQAARRALAG
jgi:F-type H+-transporting ATPase subunit delta